MLGVDVQNLLAILLIPIFSTVEDEETAHIRKGIVNLEVINKRLAFGRLQEEDIKIKLSRPPPRRVSRVSA